MSVTPRPSPLRRLGLAALLLAVCVGGAGCSALSSLSRAAQPLETYALNPLPAQGASRSGATMLFVAEPTVPGAIGSDRIVMRPNALQVTLLADGRWVEPAPAHLRSVIARSFASSGRFAFVTTTTLGPLPDYTLLTDVEHFEAWLLPPGGAPARVMISITFSVVRDAGGQLIASRRFFREAFAADTDSLSIATAFDVATGALLREAVPWATAVMTGSPGA